MLDCISGGRLVAGFPVGTSMDTNFCYGQIPALTREKYAEAHDLIIKAWTDARAVRVQRPLQQAAPRQHLAAADPAAASADPHPRRRLGRDLRLLHRQHLLVLLPQLHRLHPRQGADGRLLGAGRRAQRAGQPRPTAPASRRPSASPRPTRRPSGSTGQHVNYFYNRCLHVYPGFADAPGYRTIKTIQTGALSQYAPPRGGFAELTWKDLIEGGHVIAGCPETVRQRMEELIKGLQRRQHLLPHARRQHADRKVHVLDQAVRREGDAEAARHVPRVRRATSASGATRSPSGSTPGTLPAQRDRAPDAAPRQPVPAEKGR